MTWTRWMQNLGILTLVAVGLVLPATTWAETKGGDLELSLAASLTNTKVDNGGGSTTSIFALTSIGYFFAPAHELELGVNGTFRTNGQTTTDFGFAAKYKFHFNTQGIVIPYVGPQVGIQISQSGGGGSDSSFLYGGQVGVDYFLSERTKVFAEYDLQRVEISGGGILVNQGVIGLRYIFR